MSVRIIKDFWNNVKSEEDLIKRCFFYILKKCPDPEGINNAYNNMILELFLHDVFNKFDNRKLMRSKLIKDLINKGTERKAAEVIIDSQMEDKEYSVEDYETAGIDLRKKYEQFIFTWINKFLREQYDKNGKRYLRTQSYFDTDYSMAALNGDPSDIVSASDLEDTIYHSLKNDKERFVFEHVIIGGRKEKVVARYLKCSPQYVNALVKGIREKTQSICSF